MPRSSHWLDMKYVGFAFMAYLLMIGFIGVIGFATSDDWTWGQTHTVTVTTDSDLKHPDLIRHAHLNPAH